MGSLDGTRVVELASTIAGPLAAMYLADHGAEVIKVEPISGELSRFLRLSSYVTRNRNKRAICINVAADAGKEILYKLLKQSDVFITNLLPIQTERLRVTYEIVHQLNPRVIYGHITGYGSKGSFANQSAFDQVLQARTGLMAARRMPDGTPIAQPVFAADYSAAMMLAYGISMALLVRQRTGSGQKVEISLLDMALNVQSHELVTIHKARAASESEQAQATVNVYKCQDDKWLTVVLLTDQQWKSICKALELEHLINDPTLDTYEKRVRQASAIYSIFDGIFQTKPRDKWLKALEKAGLPAGPVLERKEVMDDPVVAEHASITEITYQPAGPMRMVGIPLHMSVTPGEVREPPPQLGEHTCAILRDLGYGVDDINQMKQDGTVA